MEITQGTNLLSDFAGKTGVEATRISSRIKRRRELYLERKNDLFFRSKNS